MAGAAVAADLPAAPYYTAPASYSAYSWAGPYVGGTLGYEWGNVSNNPTHPSGVAGGLDAGFNWQHGAFVYGAEADFSLSGAEDTFAPWQFSNPWFGTVRGRAGVAINNVLVYGTAGLAYGELTADTAGNLSESHTSFGWVPRRRRSRPHPAMVGQSGVALSRFCKSRLSVTGTNNGLAANLLRLGVNYHF